MAFQRENLQILFDQPKSGAKICYYKTTDTHSVVLIDDYFSYSYSDDNAVKLVPGSLILISATADNSGSANCLVVTEVTPNIGATMAVVKTKPCLNI